MRTGKSQSGKSNTYLGNKSIVTSFGGGPNQGEILKFGQLINWLKTPLAHRKRGFSAQYNLLK